MSALASWRERNGVSLEMLAVASSSSVGLLERIEAGEVEPAMDLAVRLHVLSGAVVAVSAWPSLQRDLYADATAVVSRRQDRWGVSLLICGAEAAWLPSATALELGNHVRDCAELASRPPAVIA